MSKHTELHKDRHRNVLSPASPGTGKAEKCLCDISARNFGERIRRETSADAKLKKWGVSTNKEKKQPKWGVSITFSQDVRVPWTWLVPRIPMWSSCEAPVGGEVALCVCVHPQSVLARHLTFC